MKNQRQQLLQLLYAARVNETLFTKTYVTERELTDTLGNCQFNLGVLVELVYIEVVLTQGLESKFRITAAGVLAAEQNAEQP